MTRQHRVQVVTGPNQVTFGPGYLESVVLHRRGVRLDGHAQVQVRTTGTVRVYCGQGWEHAYVPVNHRYVRQADVMPGPEASDDAIAHALVEAVLSDWSDPCSTEG